MRRRSWVIVLFCLGIVSLLLSQLSSASTSLRVNEAGTKVLLEDKQTNVSLAIENPTGQAFPAHVRLEVLNPKSQVVALSESDETIKRGNAALVIPLPLHLTGLSESERNEMLWYRLRYQIAPLSSSGAKSNEQVEGIVSLSEITPDIFQLSVTAPEKVREGTRYRAQIRTIHPVTSRPVKGVQVEAKIDFDDDNELEDMKVSGVTDANGYAGLDFDLPRKIENGDDLDLEVVARRGILVEEADAEIDIDRDVQILISTDKPLYQPGQVLHVRALMFDSSRHAVSERDATLEIKDPTDQTVFSAELKTSRFGIISADWAIPDNIKLGDYNLKIEMDNGDDQQEAYASVKVSRYEIPNFAVQVKPDLPYYLPGQNATVEVRADYLFGQPVKRGHVRVVREKERSWNYREQKWEAEEAEKYEGETNEQGAFMAHIDFSKEHDKLRGEDYSRFHDLSYAAYFTDPTTNRTEQRRFELRLTKSAIHVYLIESDSRQTRDFPLQFYLSTYYANGVPAQCEVTINESITSTNPTRSSVSYLEQPLRTIKTNRYGVAKVSNLALIKASEEESEATLTFLAHDNKGASGRQTNSFWYSEHPVIRLATNKTIYRPGEAIAMEIAASEPEMRVAVDVWQGPVVIQSQIVRLHNGRAFLNVPYNNAFRDSVTITAYSYSGTTSENRYEIPSAMRRVLYPRERDLKLDVRLNQSTYKPGEEAHADFTVRDSEGRPIESALGVVVFDKAVEERARTDREFGSRNGFYETYNGLSGYEGELSGLTGRDFFKLDLSKPVPEGMELVAEIMMRGGNYYPHIFGGRAYSLDQREIFSKLIARQVKPTEEALAAHYASKMEYPNDEASLHRLLGVAELDFSQQRDPWGTPFRASFNVERELDVLRIASAGADKRFDTDDDFIATRMFWPYFRPLGETLNRTVEQYHKRTGGYIHDAVTVQSELLGSGTNFSVQRDPWGKPYTLEFGLSGTNFTVAVKSGGPNGKFETSKEAASDDFTVWTSFADYFFEKREELSLALANHIRLTGLFPQNEKELRASLDKTQLYLEDQRDPWGQNYYVAFSNDARLAAPFAIQTYSTYDEATKKGREVSPLTQPNNLIRVRSVGADGKIATADDFDVAALSRKEIESISRGQHSSQVSMTATLTGASGAIMGTITDPADGVVPGAKVTATHASSAAVYEATTDDEGRFILRNLPVGFYTVKFQSPGFSDYVIDKVPVRSSNITRVDGMLQLGAATATVEITSSSESMMVNTTNTTVAYSVTRNFSAEYGKSAGGAAQVATPRLREYFPETLVWQPLIETDAQGRAQLDFKLADNITTWKMAIIGSTVDGEVGIVEKEIRAFQPFFVEHDPPRVLTEGDEIQLPVVLRNYLDKSQAVELEIKPESWFALLSPARKLTEVASGDSSRETFDFRAVSSINDGKQRITATGNEASDAIEKPISVHPDGEERALTTSQILGDSTTLEMSIPAELIKGSLRGELKIYPNLMSHVTESVEGILVRPYGCGEQTVSSTYPNLMILRFNKSAGVDSPVTAKARKYLSEGYKRLLNYRVESGGFSYWGGSESANFALTAYALRFLNDAREYIQVDEALIDGARDFLIKQQQPDGSWTTASTRYGSNQTTPRENIVLTSYIARVIASVEAKSVGQGNPQTAPGQKPSLASLALKHALDYLTRHIEEADEPYAFASYALAAMDAGETAGASRAIARLRAAAHANDDGTISWASDGGTPFYGWGMAGRIEMTALALQAMAKYCGLQNADCGLKNSSSGNPPSEIRIPQLMDRALLYLLRQKDRYGVWQSTQATINVLNALIAVLSKQETGAWTALGTGTSGQAEVIINGRPATSVTLPPGRLNNPLMVDISQFISPGDNQILIRRGGASQLASAQVVSTFYVPWSVALAAHSTNAASKAMRLAVSFSKSQASINEEVTCKVEVGGRNFGGMLLGEIGMPPGADVDRASLELAVKNSGGYLSRYDVLPDRLIIYLWPHPDGTKFEFKFRPRFGLTAQTAPSLLYDYYNPEARTIVAPTKFIVK